MKFLYILIFVGSIILPLSPMGEDFKSFDALTLRLTKYRDDGSLQEWRVPIIVSKHKLTLSIANELSSVTKVYDVSSSEDTQTYDHLSEAPNNYRTLFFTAETKDNVIPIQCTVSYSGTTKGEIPILLLQNCENNEFVFSKKEIQIPFSEIEGPLDLISNHLLNNE